MTLFSNASDERLKFQENIITRKFRETEQLLIKLRRSSFVRRIRNQLTSLLRCYLQFAQLGLKKNQPQLSLSGEQLLRKAEKLGRLKFLQVEREKKKLGNKKIKC